MQNQILIDKWSLDLSEGGKIFLYQPKQIPTIALGKFGHIFKKYPEITEAIYGKISISSANIEEYDLIGLQASIITEKFLVGLFSDIDLLNDVSTFRIVDLNQDNAIVDYLKKNQAFYRL